MTDTSREVLIKELRMIGPLSHGHFSDVGNRAADMLETDARDTAWQRGFQSGVSSNEKTAKDAVAALAVEQAAHRETNRLMTEALMQAEAQQVAVPMTLTDAEIDAVTLVQWGEMHGQPLAAHRAFARAIEAMLAATQGAKP